MILFTGLALMAFSSLSMLTGCGGGSNQPNRPNVVPGGNGNAGAQNGPPAVDLMGGQPGGQAPQGEQSLRKNWYFVIDGSGSMSERPPRSSGGDKQFRNKMEGAIWAVLTTVENLPPDVNLGLYVFDAYGAREVIQLGSNNKDAFVAAVKKIRAGNGTPLGDAIAKGADALADQYRKQLGYGEYRLFVVTDGEATDDLNYGVNKALSYRMPIYTIGFGIEGDHALRRSSVSYKSADSASDVKQGLAEATAELEVYDPANFPARK
jgi:hypothetical protein